LSNHYTYIEQGSTASGFGRREELLAALLVISIIGILPLIILIINLIDISVLLSIPGILLGLILILII